MKSLNLVYLNTSSLKYECQPSFEHLLAKTLLVRYLVSLPDTAARKALLYDVLIFFSWAHMVEYLGVTVDTARPTSFL